MVSGYDFGSQGPEFESCWRQNSAIDCMTLHCTVFDNHPSIVLNDLNNVDRDVKHQTHHLSLVGCSIKKCTATYS